MDRRLFAVALWLSVCTQTLHSLRVYEHVKKTNKHKEAKEDAGWFGLGKEDVVVQAIEKLVKDQLEKAFTAQDKDGDGEVSADEFNPAPFHRLFVDKVLFYRRKQFVDVDKDADGSHTKEEVRNLLQLENEEKMTAILKDGDANEDGAVTFDEFMAQAKSRAEQHASEKDEKMDEMEKESPEFKKAFAGAMDGSKSGDGVKAAASKMKLRREAREKKREGFLKNAEKRALSQFERCAAATQEFLAPRHKITGKMRATNVGTTRTQTNPSRRWSSRRTLMHRSTRRSRSNSSGSTKTKMALC